MLSQFQRMGSGCGIEIRGDDLHVIAVKSRRAGLTVLGSTKIERFRNRPAAEWGAEYADFLVASGLSHVSATVSLPRRDVIVRQIQLPPMKEKERAAAVLYQLDALHPFAEDEVFHAYSVLDTRAQGPTPVVVVVAEREIVTHYADLFEEAGIAIAAFTVAASSLRAALQLRQDRMATPLLLMNREGTKLEVYGESTGRPVLNVEFNLGAVPADRALQLAEADLRLERGESAALILTGEPIEVEPSGALTLTSPTEVFPVPLSAPSDFDLAIDIQSLATAIESACPRLGWGANLLPADRRQTDSRLVWAPTAVLVGLLVILAAGFLLRPVIQNRAYAASIEEKLVALEEVVASAESSRVATADVRERVAVLEGLGGRTTQDLRILSEMANLLPASAWLQTMTLDDDGIRLNGEARSAAPLLGILNQANTVEGFAFGSSLVQRNEKERFEIVALRGAVGALPTDQTSFDDANPVEEPIAPDSDLEPTDPPETVTATDGEAP